MNHAPRLSSPLLIDDSPGFSAVIHAFKAPSIDHAWMAVTFGALLFFLLLEKFYPSRRFRAKIAINSYLTNGITFIFNNVILSLLSVTSLYFVAQQPSNYGLLSGLSDNLVKWIISFLLFDLFIYLWHFANHQVPFLWKFHRVHHSDKSLNVTTGMRFHVGELVLTVVTKAAFIVITGIEAEVILLSEIITTLFVMFHHSNIAFKGESALSKAIIVPAVHRVHHSIRRDEHDNNYGVVLSFWDRLFGTAREGVPTDIGLEQISDQNFWALLRFGFSDLNQPKHK